MTESDPGTAHSLGRRGDALADNVLPGGDDLKTLADTPTNNLPSSLLTAPMSRVQIIAIAVTVMLCALDGFDVLAITFAAPGIAVDWGIGKTGLGLAFSAGLLGVAAGSFFLAPLADYFGRRPVVLASLLTMAAGTLWTATTGSLVTLALSRAFTGLGIGAMIAVINPLAAEYANANRRDLAVSLVNIGYPAGGVLGGLLAASLLPHLGWRSIFVGVGLICIAMIAVTLRALPEPPSFLIARPRPDSLARVNRYLRNCGHAALSSLPSVPPARSNPVAALFSGEMAATTIKITAVYLLNIVPVFYMQTWVPTLVVDSGFTPAQAATVSMCLNIGGIFGGLFIGFASARLRLKSVVVGTLVATSVLINLFGKAPADLPSLEAAAFVGGFCVFAGMVGVYAVVARTFPTQIRASGTGFVIGIGRLGSVASPLLASALFATGLGRAGVSAAMACPALLAAAVLLTLYVRSPQHAGEGS